MFCLVTHTERDRPSVDIDRVRLVPIGPDEDIDPFLSSLFFSPIEDLLNLP